MKRGADASASAGISINDTNISNNTTPFLYCSHQSFGINIKFAKKRRRRDLGSKLQRQPRKQSLPRQLTDTAPIVSEGFGYNPRPCIPRCPDMLDRVCRYRAVPVIALFFLSTFIASRILGTVSNIAKKCL